MNSDIRVTSEAATGNELAEHPTSIQAFGNKAAVGRLAGGMSNRWVDYQIAQGMPHLKIGRRRVRFDLAEVRNWLKDRYRVQRPTTVKASIEEPAK